VLVVLVVSVAASLATVLAERIAEKFYQTDRLVGYATDWRTAQLLVFTPVAAFLAAGIRNYASRKPFQSSAFVLLSLMVCAVVLLSGFHDESGRASAYSLRVPWSVLPASIAITLALVVLSALALSCSIRFSTVPTMMFCAVILVMGLVAGQWVARHASVAWFSPVVACVVPDWTLFWLADLVAHDGAVWSALGGALLYALVYASAALAAGVALFSETEVTT
jgi:hypothetical protein